MGRREYLADCRKLNVEEAWRLPNETMGYYDGRSKKVVVIKSGQLQMTKTLAHHFADHATSTQETGTNAEACADVVCQHFGLDTGSRSFPYVAYWTREPRDLKAVLGATQRVSSKMIRGLEGDEQHEDERIAISPGTPTQVFPPPDTDPNQQSPHEPF